MLRRCHHGELGPLSGDEIFMEPLQCDRDPLDPPPPFHAGVHEPAERHEMVLRLQRDGVLGNVEVFTGPFRLARHNCLQRLRLQGLGTRSSPLSGVFGVHYSLRSESVPARSFAGSGGSSSCSNCGG